MKQRVLQSVLCGCFGLIAASAPAQAPAPAAQANTPLDQVVVTVNGDPVYAGEVQMAAQQMAQAMAQSGQEVDFQQIGAAAMQQMVDGMLLAQEADRRELNVDPEVISAGIAQAEKSAGGAEKLDETLAAQGMSRDRLKTMIGHSHKVNQLLQQMGEGIEVSDEEVQTFYDENPTFFEAPAQVKARHILFKAGVDADDETKAAAREKAEAARKRALDGEDFAELAKEVSEGPSGPKGGDLGFFTKDRMVEPFASAAFALKPGEISQVVTTQFGSHVIKVEERREAHTVPLEQVKERIRMGMAEEAKGLRVEELLKGLRESAKIVPVGQPGGEAAPAPVE